MPRVGGPARRGWMRAGGEQVASVDERAGGFQDAHVRREARPHGGVVEHARRGERTPHHPDARVLVLGIACDLGVSIGECAEELVRAGAGTGPRSECVVPVSTSGREREGNQRGETTCPQPGARAARAVNRGGQVALR